MKNYIRFGDTHKVLAEQRSPDSHGLKPARYKLAPLSPSLEIDNIPKPELQTPIVQWPNAISSIGLEGVTNDKVPT